jgi:DNA-binding transcriptional LysR family regulator
MDFTSRQLRAFVLVAEHRNFTRAAEAMYLTPSGISVLIRELEAQVGARLFERTTRHVALTAHGQALVPIARRTLDDLSATARAAGERDRQAGDSITVGAAPLVAANLLPPAIKQFRAHRPEIRVRVFDADQGTIIRHVTGGDIDFGIGVFGATPGIRRTRLFEFSFILIRAGDSAGAQTATWSAAAGEPLIVLPAKSPLQQLIDRQLARTRTRRPEPTVVNALDTQIAMVEAGQGVAIIPSFGLPVCRNRDVSMSRLVTPAVRMDFHQVESRGRQLPPGAEEFAAFLRGYVSRWAGRAGIL